MMLSVCYVDFQKRDCAFFDHLSCSRKFDLIRTSCEDADVYFTCEKSTNGSALLENDRFVLLFKGALEEEHLTPQILLERFEQNGVEETLQTAEGVFSWIVLDKKVQKLYASTDHFASQNLYYALHGANAWFSHGLRAIKEAPFFEQSIDPSVLGHYLQHGYIAHPYTIFKNCFKLKAAHVLVYDLRSKEMKTAQYWDITWFYEMPRCKLSEEEIIQKTEQLLHEALLKKSFGASKVGAFLSGGYDSSTLTALLKKTCHKEVLTYTIGFEDKAIDEAPYAAKIAEYLETSHKEIRFDEVNVRRSLAQFGKVYDEPIGDKAALATLLIAERASEESTMLFGGEGGDEVFAASGFLEKFNLLNKIPCFLRRIASKVFSLGTVIPPCKTKFEKWSLMLGQKEIGHVLKYKDMTCTFDEVNQWIKAPIEPLQIPIDDKPFHPSTHHLDRIFPYILTGYVSGDLLAKSTQATEFYGMSLKTPYLDKKVVEFLAQVPMELKYKNQTKKYILKKLITRFIPPSLMQRPKSGFAVPVGSFLKGELRDLLEFYLSEERLLNEGIFDPAAVLALKKRFLHSGSYYHEQNIWNIIAFELWYAAWFNE